MTSGSRPPALFYSEGLESGGILVIYRKGKTYTLHRVDADGEVKRLGVFKEIKVALEAVDEEREKGS